MLGSAAAAPIDKMAPDTTPAVATNDPAAPVAKIDNNALRLLGQELNNLFDEYSRDRRQTELKYLRNLRQYLGIYDPEIEKQIPLNRSRAYPRITRVKCISFVSRVMNLMYPGNETNWELQASPSAEMDPADVAQAVKDLMAERQKAGIQDPVDSDVIDAAVQKLADKRAADLSALINDQLQELGGDQTLDVIALDRKVVQSGVMYGVGVLEGPYVREEKKIGWVAKDGSFAVQEMTVRKPQYDVTSVWDFYPDMAGRTLPGEGYFLRKIMGPSQVRKLADRADFFAEPIKKYLKDFSNGNYKPKEFETELRVMGTKTNVNDIKTGSQAKFEIIIWKGPVKGDKLAKLGVTVADDKLADDIDAEVWMIDGKVIKAVMNQWKALGIDVKTVHTFLFDEDDTSPIGNGMPNVVRDSQMSICAATRMTLDNASISCGPQFEINTTLMRTDQDVTAIEAYKNWYRDDDGNSAQFPAIRKIDIDSHIPELQSMVEMFMKFADMETFVGPATGGDSANQPSEPMRTAAGASMLRGDAALPFKDIVRNFDTYKQSQILALVQFNRQFNPGLAPPGNYNVIARGATSLIAKEVRGMQLDQLAQSLTDEDKDNIDARKFIEARFASRDMASMLLPPEEAARNKQQREQSMQTMQELSQELQKATTRKTLADAFKAVTQGQKNTAQVDATTTNTALDILQRDLDANADGTQAKAA